MEKIYVYKITNNLNSKYYIGVHKHTGHKKDYYMGSGTAIKAAIKKYGVENFTKEILKEFKTYDEALAYEKELVTQKEVDDKMCYNMKEGGLGGATRLGSIHSEQSKKKMSNTMKGKKRPNISKAKIGFKISEETKKKISKTLYGNKLSEETKKKISESNKGNKHWLFNKNLSEEHKEKIKQGCKGRKAWNKGKTFSEETKRKMSESAKNRSKNKS